MALLQNIFKRNTGQKALPKPKRLDLLPLTPQYIEVSHKVYVELLNEALKNKDIHNIALAGHYGVGKSSILSKVADENEPLGIISISLSSVRVDPIGTEESKTNQIQKEIVKQLLYREAPSKTPGSRYKRLGQYDQTVEFTGIAIATLFVFAGLFFTGQVDKLIPYRDFGAWLVFLQYAEAYLVLLLLFLVFRRTTFSRIWLDKFSAGPTTLTLAKPVETYFDDFLDELVYFFDVSKTQVVIFEDLDRFNDPMIFDNLKTLNSLLNTAGQLKGRSIRFIYAIRDSIFDSLGDTPNGHAISRSNKTKFFDVVVPVVPFITHNNARDLMTSVMGDIEHKVSEKLVRIAARHVTDMRVLKNIRNEFLLFRDRIFGNSDHGSVLGLSEENLYAMILYKNTHLGDFEKISTAESDLDNLYRESRLVVNAEVSRLTVSEAEANTQLANLNSVAERSKRLGIKLINALDCLQGLVTSPSLMTGRTAVLAGSAVDDEGLKLESTWTALTTASETLTVTFTNPGGQRVAMTFTLSNLETLLGEPLAPDFWQKADRAKLEERVRTIRTGVEEVRKADFADLIRLNPRATLNTADGSDQGFQDFVLDCLKSELARELAAGGFIDRNFTLYTSVYHGVHVSVSAKNFLMKCIEQQVMDAEFTLERDDVEAVLDEVSDDSLAFRGAYNVNLLDHLLESGDKRCAVLVRSLAELGDDERKFLGSYWIRGKQQLRLALELGQLTPDILTYLISDETVPDVMSLPTQVKKETT